MPPYSAPVILYHTLGNRDLQFRKNAELPVDFARRCLGENTELPSRNHLIIRKDGLVAEGKSFRDFTAQVLRACEQGENQSVYQQALAFPLLQAVIDHVCALYKRIDRLVLLATHQMPPHGQDTDLLAQLALRYLEKREDRVQQIQFAYLDVSPTRQGRLRMVEQCEQLFQPPMLPTGPARVFVSNRQGLPDITHIIDCLGFLQAYTYLAVHAREGVETVDHRALEQVLWQRFQSHQSAAL